MGGVHVTTALAGASGLADKVRAEAKTLEPGRVLLTLLFLVPFVVGWLAAAIWTAGTWLWAAAVVGYRSGRARPRRDASA
jgi:hypothetical protein